MSEFNDKFPYGLDYSDVGQGGICGLNVEQIEYVVEASINYDRLTEQVKELEFSLDDRDCYIADADMKNEDLLKENEELKRDLKEIMTFTQGLVEECSLPLYHADVECSIGEYVDEWEHRNG